MCLWVMFWSHMTALAIYKESRNLAGANGRQVCRSIVLHRWAPFVFRRLGWGLRPNAWNSRRGCHESVHSDRSQSFPTGGHVWSISGIPSSSMFTKHSFDNQGVSCFTYQLDEKDRKCHLIAILFPFTGPLEAQYNGQSGGVTQKCMHHPNTRKVNDLFLKSVFFIS